MTTLCGRCETCREGMKTKSFAELELTCKRLAPKMTKISAGFYQLSMGALGYANIEKKANGWTCDVRDSGGGYRRSLAGLRTREDAKTRAISILRFE